ncbi:HAMP domain-containing sensor histidine kinase [Bradyrhizobium sp. Arg237L]|uniref:sensor histidine kinase n=1 Tax=Bradyrhizobium sp. Arg237L TaxID=3003352 RepID=UPI00249F1D65|nr:HAMP domain-containing sensor histidine kinase [Bradyrhizobium sp. Arg237L]MDI4238294.1 HAMP domain-containing sensor histidine kinase [Bradyrhizobium sp. Arg237L]
MKSITRTLTLSLGAAATAIFLLALLLVVWLDIAYDGPKVPCEVAATVLSRATVLDPGRELSMRPTGSLRQLQSGSPELWYVISSGSLILEHGRQHRPPLPIAVPYTGPVGLSVLDTADKKSSFCLDIVRRGGVELTLIVGGAQVTVREMAKAFLLRNIPVILTLAFAFAATVAAGALFSALIVARSIDRVTKLALTIDPTAPQAAISLDNAPVELKPLLNALNRAFLEIDGYIQKQRRFLGNAAHQLRTPLTLMRAKIEDLPEPARAALVRDIRRLAALVSAMLDLARLQGQPIEKRPIDLVALTEDVLADFGPSALDAGIELSLEQQEHGAIVVRGVEAAIRSALANLIGNALIHAHGAKRIVADLGQGSVSISDDGLGISESAARKFAEPFQTGSPAMESAGLGLSIVHEIMAAHGGMLIVTSAPETGTKACLRFSEASSSVPSGYQPGNVKAT